jgi:hypothetical protein
MEKDVMLSLEQAKAAQILEISYRSLLYKIKEYAIGQ